MEGLAKDRAGRAGKGKILEGLTLHTMEFRLYRQMLVSLDMMAGGEPYELKVRESLLGALMAI